MPAGRTGIAYHICVIRESRLHQFKLDNGLPVLIKPVKNSVVTLDVWVNTGSANESPRRNGISHFLEHMMFKGTPKYGPGELDKTVMSVGGVWNAGTSKDFTHYYVTVASPYFETALDCLAEMIQHSLIDAKEFDQEKMVILEEYRRKQDDPFGLLYDELYEASFSAGPYRQSVLGSFESISDLERDDMYQYYRRYYTADNMVLLIVGDIDPAECMKTVRKAFAAVPTAADPVEDAPRETVFGTPGIHRLQRDVNETYLGSSFPAPAMTNHQDVIAMDVALTLLGDGRSSRLYRTLKEEKRLVNTVSAGFATHRFPGMAYLVATLSDTEPEEVIREATAVFRGLVDNPPTESDMAKARRVIRNGLLFGMETNTGQSSTIGYYFTLTGNTQFLDDYLKRLDAITPDDISRVARQYFSGDPVSIIVEPNLSEVKGAA